VIADCRRSAGGTTHGPDGAIGGPSGRVQTVGTARWLALPE